MIHVPQTATLSIIDAPRLSLTDVAGRLDVGVSTVWRWVMRGSKGRKLASILVGGRRYVLESDLESFLAAGKTAGVTPSNVDGSASTSLDEELLEIALDQELGQSR